MATTAIWNIKGRLSTVINYAGNPIKTEIPNYSDNDIQGLRDVMQYAVQDYKTEKYYYVSGINCFADSARAQMMLTKKRFGKTDGNIAYHGYQSFAEGEVTPGVAHQIGTKLAQSLWGDKFEVVVATHLDKTCIHNHFVINSVSFIDGKKYNDCKASYGLMRERSDQLCNEYQLSIINTPKTKGKHYSEWMAEQEGKPTWRSLIREDIDMILDSSFTFNQFITGLKNLGYEVKTNVKYIAVRPEGKERFVRLQSLGEAYSEEAIKERIISGGKEKNKRQMNKFYAFQKSSLRGLYYHYLYALGILPKNNGAHKFEAPFFMREKLLVEDEIIREYQILANNHINTYEELSYYQATCKLKIGKLYAKKKTVQDEFVKNVVSEEIKVLKREVNCCEHIAKRSVEMFREQREYAKSQENIREEIKKDDKQRSPRPDREHDA